LSARGAALAELRALIVDDERLARRELRALLEEHGGVNVAGEAGGADEAAALIRELRPDVVFLDIQMPGATGFDLLERVEVGADLIFVTAYDEYALRAFEVNALDYLLKPVSPERLARALARLPRGRQRGEETPLRKLEYDDRLFLETGGHSRFIKVCSIALVAAAADYSEVHTDDGRRALVQKPLREWEARLPEKHFLRVHRSTIINLEHVERIESWFNRSYRIHLRRLKEPITVSRRYASSLKSRFG
jgi:two-component system LytT family response regulator